MVVATDIIVCDFRYENVSICINYHRSNFNNSEFKLTTECRIQSTEYW